MPQGYVNSQPFPYKTINGIAPTPLISGVVQTDILGTSTLSNPYGTGAYIVTAPGGGTSGYVLISGSGAGAATSWTSVSTLPAGNATQLEGATWEAPLGIGSTTPALGVFTNVSKSLVSSTNNTTTILTSASVGNLIFTALHPSVQLPATATLFAGWSVNLIYTNASLSRSSSSITTSTGVVLAYGAPLNMITCTCVSTGADTAANWFLSTGVYTDPGSTVALSSTGLNGTSVGASTKSSGAFTTLTATTPVPITSGGTGSSTAVGTGSVVLATGPTIQTSLTVQNTLYGVGAVTLDSGAAGTNIVYLCAPGSGGVTSFIFPVSSGTTGQYLASAGMGNPLTWTSLKAPTIQFGSSTTYTTPSPAPLYLRIEMWGAGGGGAGGGGAGATSGSNGTSTYFGGAGGNVAGGGGGGYNYPGGGGGITSTAVGINQAYSLGNCGGIGFTSSSSFNAGGDGGVAMSLYPSMARGGMVAANQIGVSNSGGGGAGGSGATTISAAGAGGGSGAYFTFQINSPTSTYTIQIGAGGAGGASGSGAAATGGTGGAGANGQMIVYEYYQ